MFQSNHNFFCKAKASFLAFLVSHALIKVFVCLFFFFVVITHMDHAHAAQKLRPWEKERIALFEKAVPSVVGITNMREQIGFFESSDSPAGTGSGFVWDNNGHIVTNFHVINGGDKFLVSLYRNSKNYEADVIGVDPRKDIAVLKLKEIPKGKDGKSLLGPITLGTSSDIKVGQDTYAIGSPFHLNHTLTAGIISAIDRPVQGISGLTIPGCVQTDAAINPGNSGGPLFNSSGEVVGVNVAIVSTSQSSAGIGFAIPIDTVKRSVEQIIKTGKVSYPILGIEVIEDPSVKARFDIDGPGVIVRRVEPGGPADKAQLRGLRQTFQEIYLGDIITHLDGKEVNNRDDIAMILEQKKYGDKVLATLLRAGKKVQLHIKLFEIDL